MKQQNKKKQTMILWILAGMLGLALICVAIWAILVGVNKSSDTEEQEGTPVLAAPTSSNGSYDYMQQLFEARQSAEDSGVSVEEQDNNISKLVDDTLASDTTAEQKSQLNIAYAAIQMQNGNPQAAIDLCSNVDPESLGLEDLQNYYSVLQLSYSALGNSEQAREYLKLEQATAFKIEEEGE